MNVLAPRKKPLLSFVAWKLLDLSYLLWQCVLSSEVMWFDKMFSFIGSEFVNTDVPLSFCMKQWEQKLSIFFYSATNHEIIIGMASQGRVTLCRHAAQNALPVHQDHIFFGNSTFKVFIFS